MAVFDHGVVVLSLDCPDGSYPSVGALHAPAIRLERAARDLFGLDPVGLPDRRPWLDHGANPTAYPFLPVEGESLHQIPVGPVHAGIIEPGHFRFTADGETVVRLEQRLGYVHKGIDHLMHGATLEHAARLAGRTSGDSTVAYAFAFARAVESGARHRAAAARGLAARRDGGDGAHRQPPRRFRRDLQRCVVQHHAGALRHAARARAALCRRVLRASPDDGLHRAGRRRGRSASDDGAGIRCADRRDTRALSGTGGALRQDRVAAGPHGRHRHPVGRAGTPLRCRRLCRPRVGPRFRRAPVDRLSAV